MRTLFPRGDPSWLQFPEYWKLTLQGPEFFTKCLDCKKKPFLYLDITIHLKKHHTFLVNSDLAHPGFKVHGVVHASIDSGILFSSFHNLINHVHT